MAEHRHTHTHTHTHTRVLKLLEKYGVGPNIRNYIYNIWDKQIFILRQAEFYSDTIDVDHGCTQGDVDSPIIFNIIIDAVLRSWKNSENFHESDSCFYADDGLIQHPDPDALQSDLNEIIKLFSKMGLKPNATKTKFMVFRGAPAPRAKSRNNYDNIRRTRTSTFTTTQEWRKLRTNCNICDKSLTNGSLIRHMKSQHGITNNNKYICREVQDTGSYNLDF